jgi:Na+/H+ antiporter NhaC
MDYGIYSILVPLGAIAAALLTKDVVVSLMLGIFGGLFIIHDHSFVAAASATFNGIVKQLSEEWIAKTLLFSLLVGGIIALLERSGATASFIAYLDKRIKKLDSPVGAQLLAYVIGLLIFIESSITSLVAGTIARPLCDKNGISREKLAYICDATSAPVCSLLPLNAWGALLLGLIATAADAHVIDARPLSLLVASIPYNFYGIAALLLVGFVIFKDWNIGPMKQCRPAPYVHAANTETNVTPDLFAMLLPMIVLIATVPVGLYITGEGDIFKGSGSTSVYYATLTSIAVMYPLYLFSGRMHHRSFMQTLFKGMGDMLPVATVLLLAVFIGKVIGELGTAHYLASLLQGNISAGFVPLLVFLTAAVIAFSTGTSWGTFSIMMPIALALGAQMHIDLAPLVGAVVAGGIFGDHASPISDTTVISAMAAGCDTIDHVRTQLPYALIGGLIAAAAFLMTGFLIV